MTHSLKEIFNSTKGIKKQEFRNKVSSGFIGNFSDKETDGRNYRIQIEDTLTILGADIPEFRNKKIAEISFLTTDSPLGKNFDTQNNSAPTLGDSASVYGAVLNEFISQFKKYDVFFYSINPKHSANNNELKKKYEIYKAMFRIAKGKISEDTFYYEGRAGTEIVIIISKIPLSKETQQEFRIAHPINEMAMSAGLEIPDHMW